MKSFIIAVITYCSWITDLYKNSLTAFCACLEQNLEILSIKWQWKNNIFNFEQKTVKYSANKIDMEMFWIYSRTYQMEIDLYNYQMSNICTHCLHICFQHPSLELLELYTCMESTGLERVYLLPMVRDGQEIDDYWRQPSILIFCCHMPLYTTNV